MDVSKVRRDFPILEKKVNGKPIIYFDNSCVTLKPRQVIDAIRDYYDNYGACGGRSIHKLGTGVTILMEEARDEVGRFLNVPNANGIAFQKNATEALNVVANGLDLRRGDIVLTTDKEHNSNLVPWLDLERRKGIRHMMVRSRDDNTFNMERYEDIMRINRVRFVSMTHTSNLDGVTIPAKEIIEIAHERGAMVMLDGAQSAPHRKIDVQDLDVDFFALSVHKMCGPSGMGVLYGKAELMDMLRPLMVGGSTVGNTTYTDFELLKSPHRFEAGLQDYGGIIGAGAAVKYLQGIGMDNIAEHERSLNKLATDLLDIGELQLIGPRNPLQRSGIFSFNLRHIDPHDVALILDERANIMLRSGMHCVHSWFNAHRLQGSVRATFYIYNTEKEVKVFAEEVKKLLKTFGKRR